MDESTPPVKSSLLSEALSGSKKAAECEPETPPTPDAAAALAVPSSLTSSEMMMAGAASAANFALSDLPDDLLLKILMLVDEPTRQFAVHRVR